MKVRVLYEDQLASNCEIKDYAPHKLVLACLFDRADIKARFTEHYMLAENVQPIACKGDANVRKQLEKNSDAFNDSRIAAVVCLDSDKVNRQLKLPAKSCKIDLRSAFWRLTKAAPDCAAFVLLQQNLEDVLHISQANGANFPEPQFHSAIADKNLQDRDVLLRQVARNPEIRRALTLGDAMPSFRYLVEKTAQLALLA
jgi:hypothetical protein